MAYNFASHGACSGEELLASAASSITIDITTTVPVGRLVVLFGYYYGNMVSLNSITDTNGHDWSWHKNSNTIHGAAYVARTIVTNQLDSSDDIVVNFSGNTNPLAQAFSYSGLRVNSLDTGSQVYVVDTEYNICLGGGALPATVGFCSIGFPFDTAVSDTPSGWIKTADIDDVPHDVSLLGFYNEIPAASVECCTESMGGSKGTVNAGFALPYILPVSAGVQWIG